ncbi:MAG: ATP-binding protein [Polynucleobacter sp.]|uniref:ATP-binding protein n=1 Tax=Polynucleobacter sp. TaxID=2029855 RepID=UPI002720BD7E|nr:ATP-binding protein [Polynucleobacter sp.]MDO8714346.1 ATP-binding protein [Polynucleobacter sp.]
MKHWIESATKKFLRTQKPMAHETNELDWKSQISSNKERLTEHLIAFANLPNGGYLVYGVREPDGALIGVTQEEVSGITNQLTNLGRDAIEPALLLDIAVVEVSNCNLLFVYVEGCKFKPAHKRGKTIEEAWIRSGASTRKASRNEVAMMMLDSKAPQWEELRSTPLLTYSEVLDLIDLGVMCQLLEKPIPDSQEAVINFLKAEKIVILDGDGYFITNVGGIALAKKIERFESLSRKMIRVVRYKGVNKSSGTIDEVPGKKGYAAGFEGLIDYLKLVLPHSEVIEQSLRKKVSIYPEIALRELVANALVHQDLSIMGAGPVIDIYADRIEFINPGKLLPTKDVDRLIGTTSESRNEILARKFRDYRICEERGSGFQKVIQVVELFGLPPLEFHELENAFKVVLHAPKRFSDMSSIERVEATYQHAVLQYYSGQSLTNTTLRVRFKISEKQRNQITNLISEAVLEGRIKRRDEASGNKFAEYIPYWA